MRRRVTVLAVVVIVVAVAAVSAWRFVVRMPQPGPTLGAARGQLAARGLVVSAVRADGGKDEPLDLEAVVDCSPRPGAFLLRGARVTVTTEPPANVVAMPNLLGLLEPDAHRALAEVGLRTTSVVPSDAHVVYSQEPSAGATVAFGARVEYEAAFPHPPEGTLPGVKDVHGLTYLRYGIEGLPACSMCHTARTCSRPDCHAAEAYERLEQGAPAPH